MNRRVQIRAHVRSNSEVMPGTRLLWLDAPVVAKLARPGQFVMVRCAGDGDPLLRRPLSIHGTDASGGVALLFEVVGRGTAWLSESAPGDLLDLIGPLGNGFTVEPGASRLLLVAGGVGVAPLAFLAHWGAGLGVTVTVLLGAKSASHLYPGERVSSKAKVICSTDDGSGGRKGFVTELIREHISAADQVFACGPGAMYGAMAGLDCLKGKSVQVSLEERMACGVGACYGCTVKTRNGLKQVCHDGPVFDLADIDWRGQV